jgi:hypothetical protein
MHKGMPNDHVFAPQKPLAYDPAFPASLAIGEEEKGSTRPHFVWVPLPQRHQFQSRRS